MDGQQAASIVRALCDISYRAETVENTVKVISLELMKIKKELHNLEDYVKTLPYSIKRIDDETNPRS